MTKEIQQTLIAVALFLAGLVFVYFKYLITPLNMKYKESLVTLEKTERKLSEMKRRAHELPKLQMEMNLLEMEVSELEKLLPKEKNIEDLLRTVTKTAQNFGISVSNFAPSGELVKGNYNEIPFKIKLKGTYHSLARFFASLGQESRILSARDLNITMEPAKKDKNDTVNADFELIAYIFKG